MERRDLRKRRSFLEKRATAIAAVAVVVSMLVASVVLAALSTPPPQHRASIASGLAITINSYGDVGQYSSLALGPSGNIDIMYYNASAGDWKIASYSGADWTNQTLHATPDNDGLYDSLVTNKSDVVLGCCYDATTGDLKLAWNESTAWYNMTLDTGGDVGRWTSLRVDSADNVHISYYDVTNGDLKYIMVPSSAVVIPEFGSIVIPMVGMMAIIAAIAAGRNQKEK